MAPWYKSKKIWIAVATLLGIVASRLANAPELQAQFLILGCTLIGGVSLQDFGKAGQALAAQSAAENNPLKSFLPLLSELVRISTSTDKEKAKEELESMLEAAGKPGTH